MVDDTLPTWKQVVSWLCEVAAFQELAEAAA